MSERAIDNGFVLREAIETDVPAITDLVNRAFSVERFFKSGERTNEVQIAEMLSQGRFLLLAAPGKLVACVFIRLNEERAYAGMLAVEPERQRSGIGRRMMKEAEDYARAHRCEVLDIRIVSVRPELSEIYIKFGFVPTGVESAEVIKTATQPVHFITMSKAL